ncbi:MAG: hypothetical protein P8R04_00835 [Gammaproteobacteria bacterium]|nr:hypothetical protein [Gammaproteobacteria bacterium]
MKTLLALPIIALTFLLSGCGDSSSGSSDYSATINVSPIVPQDINGGTVDSSLDAAAQFAWETFIALNWPADTSGGKRDVPDTSKVFGNPADESPLVWHTFRHKAEIYPGGTGDPAGYDVEASDFGYSTLPPVYTYKADVGTNGEVPACNDQEPVASPALINLDETSQIGLDYMFAGAAPDEGDIENDINSFPQLIRFLAQGNETYYKYAVDPNALETGGDPLYTHPSSCPTDSGDPGYDHTYCVAKRNFTAVSKGNGTPSVLPGIAVEFPAGTILVKGGFRELTPTEAASGRFYITKVRYYEDFNGTLDVCYHERNWGLVALHVIVKTPTSPVFVFATFEQSDNLLTADGQAVENVNGGLQNDGGETVSTSPGLIYADGSPPTLTINGDENDFNDYCTDIGSRLYYLENMDKPGLPSGGFICQNYRDSATSSSIEKANLNAHLAIKAYTLKNDIAKSPWEYYRLVNVQAEPFDKTEISESSFLENRSESTYYLANIMVETDYTLQRFSGQLSAGLKSDLPANFDAYNGSNTHQNVLSFNDEGYLIKASNMGGCMGCHGVAQSGGNDFSFVLSGGRVKEPEAPEISPPGTSNPAPGG